MWLNAWGGAQALLDFCPLFFGDEFQRAIAREDMAGTKLTVNTVDPMK
jgi:hypothetical protein